MLKISELTLSTKSTRSYVPVTFAKQFTVNTTVKNSFILGKNYTPKYDVVNGLEYAFFSYNESSTSYWNHNAYVVQNGAQPYNAQLVWKR